ncbi:MAG: sigma-70 family RNA polymerase sigma factor [Proteobacteria bacterium]|nr:sigma-70 family RNA polymerase sigma factor [Pseudomonadota bacterium]
MALPVLADSLQRYLSEVNAYPLLSAKEELTIAERYWNERKVEDAHTLVTSNLRYVIKVAMEFSRYGAKLADLIQEGNMGLMIAVKKFDPTKGFRLITYATWWIKAQIQDYIVKTKGLVRNGSKAMKKALFYKQDKTETGDANAKTITLAADMSLDTTLGDSTTTHLDLLKEEGPNQEELLGEQEEATVVSKGVSLAIQDLNDRERLIITERVMADEPQSLQAIGVTLGLTRERVRQIETAALKKLKDALGTRDAVVGALPSGA